MIINYTFYEQFAFYICVFHSFYIIRSLSPNMDQFQLKTAIPTASDARGIISKNGIYFPSNTHLFKLQNGNYSLVSSCDGTIRFFDVHDDYSMLCTEERVYLNHHQNLLGTLRRSVTAIAMNSDFFAIGVDNALEVWHIPREYKFTLFKRHSKNIGHYRKITQIRIIDDSRILTASEDCSVRIFDISRKESKVIAALNDVPIGLHFDSTSNLCIATCSNGSIVSVNLASMEYSNIKYDAKISASASFGDLFAVTLQDLVIPNPEKDPDLLPDTKKIPEKLKTSKNTTIVVFKGTEEVYKGEIEQKVNGLALDESNLVIRSSEFVGSYNLQSESFTFILDLPKILNISVFKNKLSAACKDGKIRIYRDNSCVATLFDEKAKGEILQTHISSNICTAVYKSGHVSSFNINDQHCFRSFSVSNEQLGGFSSSAVNEDGCFLFVSQNENIKVIDMMRSKLVETINLKSPIVKILFYRDYLYTIELDKTLSKMNIFSGYNESVALEFLPTNIAVKEKLVAVSTVKEIVFYDLNLNFLDSFSVQLEGRNRSEMYQKPKPVEYFDFNSNYVFCGGSSNFLKVFEYSCQKQTGKSLMKNFLSQVITVSRNKEWENYKTKLMKEKETKFDKERVITVQGLILNQNTAFLLSSDGLSIFEKSKVSFCSLEFNVEASEEFINKSIECKDYQKALISAIKLGNPEYVAKVIDSCADADFLVRFLTEKYTMPLATIIIWILKQENTCDNIKMIRILNRLIYWHKLECPSIRELFEELSKKLYKDLKKTKYLLNAVSLSKNDKETC